MIGDVSFRDLLTLSSVSVKTIIDGDGKENVGLRAKERYFG